MGQFKPMVKMYTDEPSVILKLKKGGKVKGHADGFQSMKHASGNPFDEAEAGAAPKKPSMAKRQKAMNPNFYAKGGKVAHKQMGGMMPGAAMPARAPMQPMARAALAGMTPAARMARAAQVRRALTGMKDGGPMCAKLEKELKHHEALSASKAHGKASGGEIDAAETKTTLKNSVAPFAKTKVVDGDKHDGAKGTGDVKMGKPGGYKHGGMLHKAMGGTIEGNEGPFENTKMVSAGKGKTSGTTGGVRMGNAGGYKAGGKAKKYASGGAIDAKLTRTTVEGGNWENRAANTSKPGKTNTTTGEVKLGNGGGYKKGGAAKKAYATGGNVVDDGKAEKMPRRPVHPPVANSLQSGTYKRGGVARKAEGGSTPPGTELEIQKARNEQAYRNWENERRKEMQEDKDLIPSMVRRAVSGVKNLFSPAAAASAPGAVTKTEKSVTVAPKKRGGSCYADGGGAEKKSLKTFSVMAKGNRYTVQASNGLDAVARVMKLRDYTDEKYIPAYQWNAFQTERNRPDRDD